MKRSIPIFAAVLVAAATLPLDVAASLQPRVPGEVSAGVFSSSDRLPPLEGAYHGTSSHVFLGGQAVLTCGSHGIFQSNEDPPRRPGVPKDIAYQATFDGELALAPPLVRETTVIGILDPIQMVERVTLVGRDRSTRIFVAELVEFGFRGSSFPAGVIVRQSRTHRTFGWTLISRLPAHRFCIETTFEVWLELTLDNGQTWHQQDRPVTMALMQER